MQPIIFLNIGWMAKYQGQVNDKISGGFRALVKQGYGHEIFNFKSHLGKMYGFAHAPHDSIKLEKLGAIKGATSVDGVLVVWVARSKIVGWYRNATVFRKVETPPRGSGRVFNGHRIGYNVVARKKDCKLLDPDDRLFSIPRARDRSHAMGRYLWYAEGQVNKLFSAQVRKYIASGGLSKSQQSRSKSQRGRHHLADPLKRKQVELSAVVLTRDHFENLGYAVKSVERDNVGWDLSAKRDGMHLRLEVKGLSGKDLIVELTPQEYEMMRKYRDSYRVCVATRCLEKARQTLHVFSHQGGGMWADANDRPLHIEERTSARLHT